MYQLISKGEERKVLFDIVNQATCFLFGNDHITRGMLYAIVTHRAQEHPDRVVFWRGGGINERIQSKFWEEKAQRHLPFDGAKTSRANDQDIYALFGDRVADSIARISGLQEHRLRCVL